MDECPKVIIECPECKQITAVMGSPSDVEGATFDCSHCGILLTQQKGEVLDFHKYLNSQDSRWPVDGKGTGSIDV